MISTTVSFPSWHYVSIASPLSTRYWSDTWSVTITLKNTTLKATEGRLAGEGVGCIFSNGVVEQEWAIAWVIAFNFGVDAVRPVGVETEIPVERVS